MDGIEQKTSKNYKQWFLIALIVGAGLVLVSGGILVYQKTMSQKESKPASEVTPTPVESQATPRVEVTPSEISPTPSAKAELKIEILNGGGVKGEAAKAAQLLDKLGYKNIKTGNADRFDYEKTEIQIKEGKKEFLQEITEALSEKYTVASDSNTLAEKDAFEVIIILGKK